MSALTQLLKPYSPKAFLKNIWTQNSIYISTSDRHRFDGLFSWSKLNYLLDFHELDLSMRLAVEGKVLERSECDRFLERCQEGATLIIDRVDRKVPELAEFISQLKREIGHPLQVNTYCSWPGKQGFNCHYDTHDVFILQIDGAKEWNVFNDTLKYPLKHQKSAKLSPPEEPPELNVILEPGDVLYIPRGHWHYALALDKPSLHLTLGVHGQTGISLLEWLVDELKEDEAWRQSLPLLTAEFPISVEERSNELIQQLLEQLSQRNIGAEYQQYLSVAKEPKIKYSLPFQAGCNIFDRGMKTEFKRLLDRQVQIEVLGDREYKITVGSKEVNLKGVPKTFVQNVFNRAHFTGFEVMDWLPGFDWELDAIPVLTRLVKEGIIFVDVNELQTSRKTQSGLSPDCQPNT
ncbi:cupin [Oscillatoriales cyanobacterium LEGE 11467]|uniref:Cupin n=1 Tax=Zarconia navalis LEGE 11467 TaxID=1828826 RepID=A0A928Z7S0_9CYAN|nr:cupin domain-containing protein [Zarconia navalis]MBE9039759.1 cupin [Zarconia navalis LEGE 11467]